MGKVDQGVFAHWLLSHRFGLPLSYIGYGGEGKQVRDLLHVEDLADLIEAQLTDPERWDGEVVNVGGGREISLSLLETTDALPRAHRRRGPDLRGAAGAPRRRAGLLLGLHAPLRAHRLAAAPAPRGRRSPT